MVHHLRPAEAADAEACGRIMHRAFRQIAESHGFPSDFTDDDVGIGLSRALIANPHVFGVVAEEQGRIVGSNFLSEGDPIRGVGPITVCPSVQGQGLGRRLMQAVIERATGAEGVRLLQDGFNMRSLALYASLGFAAREPVAVMAGRPRSAPPADALVRPMTAGDLETCDALCHAVLGISRRSDLDAALEAPGALVLVRGGRLLAYMTRPTLWLVNHGVAAAEEDLRHLLLGAGAIAGPISFLLPIRQNTIFRWCLAEGLRAVKPMTLMTRGAYRTPVGAYMPSVFY